MVETRTARVHLGTDGIVRVAISSGVEQSTQDAETNIGVAITTTGGSRRPILVDISRAEPLAPEVRRLYSGRRLTDAFLALGLMVDASPVGRLLGNVYIRIAKPAIPIKLFEDEARAIAWLATYK